VVVLDCVIMANGLVDGSDDGLSLVRAMGQSRAI